MGPGDKDVMRNAVKTLGWEMNPGSPNACEAYASA